MKLKTALDYYEQLYLEYPNVPKSDIKRIMLYGWKSLYLHNSYGGDILIRRLGFWFYIGRLMKDSVKYFNYYAMKLAKKIRVLYIRNNVPWDGYYYFARTLNLYNEYLKLKNKRGRPKEKFTFEKVILYKVYDECNIANHEKVAIFRIPWHSDIGYSYYKDKIVTKNAELVIERQPLNFNDILLTNYDCQFELDPRRKRKKKLVNEQLYNTKD